MLDNLSEKLLISFNNKLKTTKNKLSNTVAKLDALSPLKVLKRGFAVAEFEGKVITNCNKIDVGDNITLTLQNGKLNCTVNSKGE